MPFIFRCPKCGEKLEAQDEWNGMETECPQCNERITIVRGQPDENAQNASIKPIPIEDSPEPKLSENNVPFSVPESELVDQKEDFYVLNVLKGWRTCVIISVIIGTIFCLYMIFFHSSKRNVLAWSLSLMGFVWFCAILIMVICWFRGVYKNLMRMNLTLQKIQKQNEKTGPFCGQRLADKIRIAPVSAPYAPPPCGFRSRSDAPKNRLVYIVLGVFAGGLGVHNFYAGYKLEALVQLAISVIGVVIWVPRIVFRNYAFFSPYYGFFLDLLVVAWAWANILCREKDSRGREMV